MNKAAATVTVPKGTRNLAGPALLTQRLLPARQRCTHTQDERVCVCSNGCSWSNVSVYIIL